MQAAAPYALGLFLLSAALAALKELAKPLEEVIRRTLAVAFLGLFIKLSVDNWGTIYSLYEVASGQLELTLEDFF